MRELGVWDRVEPRLRPAPNGNTAMRALAASTAQRPIGCTQETEIRATPGLALVGPLPPGCELWLDGGHNEDCGLALARMASDWAREPAPLPLYLIFGMLTTKDASGFLRPLARHAKAARAVPFPEGHSAYTPQEACTKADEVGLDCAPANDIGAALEDLLATQPAPMRILICGSLYLAGAVLARNG